MLLSEFKKLLSLCGFPQRSQYRLLGHSSEPVSHTGDTNPFNFATIDIPAGSMGPNGILRIRQKWGFTVSASAKDVGMTLGGQQVATSGSTDSSAIGLVDEWTIDAQGTGQQLGCGNYANGIGTVYGVGFTSTTVDMTKDQSLVITGNVTAAADTLTLLSYTVELLNP
jgi:hypothetical protein